MRNLWFGKDGERTLGDGKAVYELSKGTGRHQVLLRLWDTSAGWVGSLTGGEVPHVGGVVLAVPRASLSGQGRSCDMWLIPVPGHLDHEVAAPLVRRLCVQLNEPISLTAGIHVERATNEDITLIRENCEAVGQDFLRRLKGDGHE
jgi:hypothetical protein